MHVLHLAYAVRRAIGSWVLALSRTGQGCGAERRQQPSRTEQAYVDWARRFILFHGKRHPQTMGADEVAAFLTHLAVERGVSASTQNQAKAALLFLYKEVLQQDLPWLAEVVAAKTSRRLPVVLTQRELRELLLQLDGTMWPRCCTAPACASSKACACGSRTWSSSGARSSCARARATRIA